MSGCGQSTGATTLGYSRERTRAKHTDMHPRASPAQPPHLLLLTPTFSPPYRADSELCSPLFLIHRYLGPTKALACRCIRSCRRRSGSAAARALIATRHSTAPTPRENKATPPRTNAQLHARARVSCSLSRYLLAAVGAIGYIDRSTMFYAALRRRDGATNHT